MGRVGIGASLDTSNTSRGMSEIKSKVPFKPNESNRFPLTILDVAPMQLRVRNKTHVSVTVVWDNPPSCYEVSSILVLYKPTGGASRYSNMTSFKKNKQISLNALLADTEYTMQVFNIYGDEPSKPTVFTFRTAGE